MKLNIDKKMVLLLIFLMISGIMIGFQQKNSMSPENNKNQESEQSLQELNQGEQYQLKGLNLETKKAIDNSVLDKPVNLVYFWQLNCSPCIYQQKVIQSLANEFDQVGFIGMGIGDNLEQIKEHVKTNNITYLNYYIEPEKVVEISDQITSTPTIMIIDQEGKLLVPMEKGSSVNSENLDVEIDKYQTILSKLID